MYGLFEISYEEVFGFLDRELDNEQKEVFMKADDLTDYHFSIGLMIRNSFGVGDVQSTDIMKQYQEYLRNKTKE